MDTTTPTYRPPGCLYQSVPSTETGIRTGSWDGVRGSGGEEGDVESST